jgi:hypothetical protein
MALLLWIIAVVLVVAGILAVARREYLWGIVLILVGFAVGPGGVKHLHLMRGAQRDGPQPVDVVRRATETE